MYLYVGVGEDRVGGAVWGTGSQGQADHKRP